jgi:hypothetical protein
VDLTRSFLPFHLPLKYNAYGYGPHAAPRP